jgi:holo-[acyl-carrier protein] synthase
MGKTSNVTIGIDVVSINRINRLLDDHPQKFRKFAYTSDEQQYCDKQAYPSQHYAVRWATKEAYIKAIGKQDVNPDLSSIEVTQNPTPHLTLTGEGYDILSEAASKRGASPEETSLAISLSHEKRTDVAVGIVIILF